MSRLRWRVLAVSLSLVVALVSTASGGPLIKCYLVVPPGASPYKDAQKRLTMVLKDVQWWYSCQMEAHGYGKKTFGLELDKKGRVRVHVVRLKEMPAEGLDRAVQFKVQRACLNAAGGAAGDYRKRKGTILLVVYNGYIWMNRKQDACWPCGTGSGGGWAFLTGYHYHNICPAAWRVKTPLTDFIDPKRYFPERHVRIMKAHYTYRRSATIQKRMMPRPIWYHVIGHGAFAHEMGHAFNLQHWKKGEPRIKMSVMGGGPGMIRGNFLADIKGQWQCLSVRDAAKLNRNPLFKLRTVGKPSTGVSREIGMRGAREAIETTRTARSAAKAKQEPRRDN